MPLPPSSAPRKIIHTRSISLDGWKREDGLWDIEARLTDVKHHAYVLSTGVRVKGDALHDMWIRITIDWHLNVLDAVGSIDTSPYPGSCETIGPAYRQLVGLNLARGFRRATRELFEKTSGCTHLTELLNSLPSAAIQTLGSEVDEIEGAVPGQKPFQLDKCHALDTTGEVVRRYYPRWYCGELEAASDTSSSKKDDWPVID